MQQLKSKSVHEKFSQFFESPTRDTLRALLKEHVGELRNCDFKEDWPDHASVAKHLLGIANTGGGCLIMGVKEEPDKTLEPSGLTEKRDKADVTSGVKRYIHNSLLSGIEVADFYYEDSEYPKLVEKSFQVLFIQTDFEALPFVCQRSGEKIRQGAIYIRHEGSTEEASHDEVQSLLKQRIAVSPKTAEAQNLKEHFEELKVLYSQIPKSVDAGNSPVASSEFVQEIAKFANLFSGDKEPNPNYPEEDYQEFVARVLEAKKILIEGKLGVRGG